jgi:hypothetical protein
MKRRAVDLVATEALNYQNIPAQQNAVEQYQYIEYSSHTALPKDDETAIEFKIDKIDSLLDLYRSYLQLEIQILNGDGTKIEQKTKEETKEDGSKVTKTTPPPNVAPVNSIGYTLFEDVELLINDQKLTSNETTYPWWTYIMQLLYCSKEMKNTKMFGNYWYEDEAGLFNNTNTQLNTPYNERMLLFYCSERRMIYVPLMFNKQFDRLLPPHTDVTIRLHRTPASLCLLADADQKYRIRICDAKLHVCTFKLTDHAGMLYNHMLSSSGYTYPLHCVQTKVRSVLNGEQNVDWTVFTGKLPKRLYFWQISNFAYNGDINANLYNFEPFRLQKMQILKNGQSLPISTGFTSLADNDYIPVYLQTINAINSPWTYNMTNFDYRHGYFIVVVDLTKDNNASSEFVAADNCGALRITLDYTVPLQQGITIFCMGEFDQLLNIDANGDLSISS